MTSWLPQLKRERENQYYYRLAHYYYFLLWQSTWKGFLGSKLYSTQPLLLSASCQFILGYGDLFRYIEDLEDKPHLNRRMFITQRSNTSLELLRLQFSLWYTIVDHIVPVFMEFFSTYSLFWRKGLSFLLLLKWNYKLLRDIRNRKNSLTDTLISFVFCLLCNFFLISVPHSVTRAGK